MFQATCACVEVKNKRSRLVFCWHKDKGESRITVGANRPPVKLLALGGWEGAIQTHVKVEVGWKGDLQEARER